MVFYQVAVRYLLADQLRILRCCRAEHEEHSGRVQFTQGTEHQWRPAHRRRQRATVEGEHDLAARAAGVGQRHDGGRRSLAGGQVRRDGAAVHTVVRATERDRADCHPADKDHGSLEHGYLPLDCGTARSPALVTQLDKCDVFRRIKEQQIVDGFKWREEQPGKYTLIPSQARTLNHVQSRLAVAHKQVHAYVHGQRLRVEGSIVHSHEREHRDVAYGYWRDAIATTRTAGRTSGGTGPCWSARTGSCTTTTWTSVGAGGTWSHNPAAWPTIRPPH